MNHFTYQYLGGDAISVFNLLIIVAFMVPPTIGLIRILGRVVQWIENLLP